MSILCTTWLILKWVLFIALVLIVWILYNMILRPWLMRRKYLKYSNCIQSSKFYPVLGDFALLLDSIKQNKFIFSCFMDSVKQNKDFDIRLYFYGEDPRFQIVSLKAHKEFIDLFPHKIDRSESMKKSLAKMCVGSFDQQLTTEKCKLIRSEFLKAIGFNEISTRIEEIIEIFDSFTNTWSEEKEINLIELVQDITFEVINHLLFGNDAAKIMNKCRFIEPDGSESILGFSECFRRILNDTLAHYHSTKYKFFPLLADHNIIEPFKTDQRNIDYLNKNLSGFVMQTKDSQSAFSKILQNGKLEVDELVNNIKIFLIGGTETSARTICCIFYFLAKYSKCYDNLIKNLISCGTLNFDGSLKSITKENLNNCDYLNYIIKEALRIDPPAVETIPYKALEDIEICGIPIPKDCIIELGILPRQYNPAEWKNPYSFIPERFDPTNSMFNKPDSESKSRDSISYAPFSFGMRSCPGQALALLEIKIGVVLLLSKFKFEIDKELIENDSVRFAVGSHFKLKCKIYKKIFN